MLWRGTSRTREVRTSQTTATPTPNAWPKPSVTCSWIRPAPIAGATKSCAPAPAASAPTAGRARDAVKDRHSLGRRRPLMQLEVFTLCDAATEHAGKLNIIGTFDSLRAFEAPVS